MASHEEILEMALSGIPRVAERIAGLSDDQKAKAFEAVELSYLQTALELDYAETEARDWVGTVMDTLRSEVEMQAQPEPVTAAVQGELQLAG